MQLYEVTYSVGSSSQTQYLKTTVTAIGIIQARAMVEGMFGGAGNCHIVSAYPQ